jgi:hypothetical protein
VVTPTSMVASTKNKGNESEQELAKKNENIKKNFKCVFMSYSLL